MPDTQKLQAAVISMKAFANAILAEVDKVEKQLGPPRLTKKQSEMQAFCDSLKVKRERRILKAQTKSI